MCLAGIGALVSAAARVPRAGSLKNVSAAALARALVSAGF